MRRSSEMVTRLLMSRCVAIIEQFPYMNNLRDEQLDVLQSLEQNLLALEPRVIRLTERVEKQRS